MQQSGATSQRPGWFAALLLAVLPLSLTWVFIFDRQFLTAQKFNGHVIGRDFVNYWTGAHLALQHRVADIFLPARYTQALHDIWGPGMGPLLSFSYAPNILSLTAWLGVLPYQVALALWTVLGICALLWATWPYSKRPWAFAAVVLAPAVLICIENGQNGLFSGALTVGAFRLLDRRPYLAGVLIGLLTVKPQLGLLIPVALLAAWRWRAIAAAAVTAAALVAASLPLVGLDGWVLWATRAAPYQGYLYRQTIGLWQTMTPSVTIGAVLSGASWAAAYGLQIGACAAMAVLVFLRFRRIRLERRRIEPLDIVVLMAAALLATPYSFNYDMAGLSAALVLAGFDRPELEQRPAWRWGLALLWAAPILMMIVGLGAQATHAWRPPLGALMVIVGLILMWRLESGGRPTAAAPANSRSAPALLG